MQEFIEICKNITTVVGCVSAITALCCTCIKPLRQAIINKVSKWSNRDSQDRAIQLQNEAIQKQAEAIKKEDADIKELKATVNQIVDIIQELKERILKNEADRLRSELFDCGNRCRRGIPLSGEEFRHIQGVFKKYSDELHENGQGEDEYNFITTYFNSAFNQDRINRIYED